MKLSDFRPDRDETNTKDSCLKLLLSDGIDDLMKFDRYHPSRCNAQSMNHHHPFHNHMVSSNLRTGKGLELEQDHIAGPESEDAMECAEWMARYKQMGATNVYVDAFECYPKIAELHRSRRGELWKDANERLMSGQRAEQMVFVLTHFHWDSFRGLHRNHRLIFNERSNNVLYCSESTAKLIGLRVPGLCGKYIKTLSLEQSTPIPEALPQQKCISMMAVDSGHCSGSIMCILSISGSASGSLFDDGAAHHLHSGDCCLSRCDWVGHPILSGFAGKIDTLWLDTKSVSFWLRPLGHGDALRVIRRHILDWLIPNALSAESSILIEIGKYSVGLEPVLIDIARHLMAAYSMKLCVQNSDVEMLKVLGLWTEQKLDRFFQTPADWKQSKEALHREHLQRLHRFTERLSAKKQKADHPERRKVGVVEFGAFGLRQNTKSKALHCPFGTGQEAV